jgi:hypothetical protein
MDTKPRLVDPAWFAKPKSKPKLKIIKKIIPKQIVDPKVSNSFMINCIGFLILCIGGICIYQRYIDRDQKELEKQNLIIGFNEYVKENSK